MIIITGSAGFIGSALTWQFNKVGYKNLILVDQFKNKEKWKNLLNKSFVNFIPKSEIFTWLEDPANHAKISFIFHMGACSSTTQHDMDFLFENNVRYSQKLFLKCSDLNIPLIYASSAATYGNLHYNYSDNHNLCPKLVPINPYGFSKKLFDDWVLQQEKKPPFWVGLKFFNVYGANEYHKEEMRRIVTKAIPQIISTGKLKLFKSYVKHIDHGKQERDFVYIKDITDLMYYLWDTYYNNPQILTSGIYNVGSGKARTFIDLGKAVFRSLDIKPEFEWVDMPVSIRSQYQYYTKADLTNLRQKTGYQKKFTPIEEGVDDYIRQHYKGKTKYL